MNNNHWTFFKGEVSYLESEYKNKLLTDYKTNDLFYYGVNIYFKIFFIKNIFSFQKKENWVELIKGKYF